jgi:hypothetical protein
MPDSQNVSPRPRTLGWREILATGVSLGLLFLLWKLFH